MSPLQKIGNIPFDIGVLASIFPRNKHICEKAQALENAGSIVRLKKGMYVASSDETGIPLCRELIANHLYGPSYVGREYALRYYGLIPERVHLLTCVTTKHSRNFENATGCYYYQNCSAAYFSIGVRMEESEGVRFLIASPEKALCDVINFSKKLNLRYMNDVERYLNEDIRFDLEALSRLDLDILQACAEMSRRKNSINVLIKYIQHVRHL